MTRVKSGGHKALGQHVLLNNIDHHDLRLITRHDAALGDNVNQVLVFPSEYSEIQRHYPILFRRTEAGGLKSVALLGLARDENLFLDGGRWNAAYVPALQRISPFMIGEPKPTPGQALPEDAGAMILVDTDHARISTQEGEPLFLDHGGQSPALLDIQQTIQTVYAGSKMSDHMFAVFNDLGLLAPIEINVQINDKTSVMLSDFFTISQEVFGKLSGEQLKQLNETGLLSLAVFVMASLSNLSHLIRLKNDRDLRQS